MYSGKKPLHVNVLMRQYLMTRFFKVHRDDQSLLDIVVRKHGIRPYRDPSDYGLRSYSGNPLGKTSGGRLSR